MQCNNNLDIEEKYVDNILLFFQLDFSNYVQPIISILREPGGSDIKDIYSNKVLKYVDIPSKHVLRSYHAIKREYLLGMLVVNILH